LRLRVCDVFNVFDGGKHVQVSDGIIDNVEFTPLIGFNPSGHASNSQILLKGFRMVYVDIFKLPAV
jgi:hypothetical protein